MEDNQIGMLVEGYYPSTHTNLGNDALGSNGGPENVNKSNTIIVRCSEDVTTQTPHTRICTTCLKIIDPDYYFSWEFMEFCNVLCIAKYQGLNFKCAYCSHFINNTLFGKFYMRSQTALRFFCSLPCMQHYKILVKKCSYCLRDFYSDFSTLNLSGTTDAFFCSQVCCEVFNETVKPKILPRAVCCVCKGDKSVDIVLKHDGQTKYFCAERCLIAYRFVKLQTDTEQCKTCHIYFSQIKIKRYTVHYENVALAFCSSTCQNIYMLLNRKIVSCSWCRNERYNFGMIRKFSNSIVQNVYICSVNCFKLYECSVFSEISPTATMAPAILQTQYPEIDKTLSNPIQPRVRDQFTEIDNLVPNSTPPGNEYVRLQHIPYGVNNQLFLHAKKTVDQRNVATMCFIPKSHKNVTAQPCTLNKATQVDTGQLILPIPVPIYVPTPMLTYSLPTPTAVPFPLPVPIPIFVPIVESAVSIVKEMQAIHNTIPNTPYEAELLKIADIIAKEKVNEEPPDNFNENDVESSISNTTDEQLNNDIIELEVTQKYVMDEKVRTKRLCDSTDTLETETNKRKLVDLFKSIKKINLNYLLGTTALQQWLNGKASSYKKSEKEYRFKTNILQMLPDELNLVLDSFVKELKKPDGSDYASDTLYYLCLGIQYYLSDNARLDNIFMDKAYNKFCDTLNKLAEKYNSLYYEESHFIVTRVEEEHLWETKQLGYHSPLVLLNTLIYFNTKYYHCSTLEQHLDVSFFQILKLWRKKSKSKSAMLRFHPKQTKGQKRVYEQYADENNQTRCPVSLYEFYLSKCPENIKTSNHLFYLQPEQYCIADSPLWYMNRSLSNDTLAKMLNRIKMVKEINIALLATI